MGMESPFITIHVEVRPHQVADIYKFAAQLAENADMEFPLPAAQTAHTVTIPMGGTTRSIVTEVPEPSKEPAKTEAPPAKQPDGPPEAIPGAVDPSKFSGCHNVNEIIGVLWKDGGVRTVADARKAFDEIRASGLCKAATVIPEDGIDTRIERAIGMLQAE